ncbi:NUDIX hydrolase (plasmid) [Streptomyces viridifaciens]|nr:NUDIX hydrolase [Streptomyces viridifaciens]
MDAYENVVTANLRRPKHNVIFVKRGSVFVHDGTYQHPGAPHQAPANVAVRLRLPDGSLSYRRLLLLSGHACYYSVSNRPGRDPARYTASCPMRGRGVKELLQDPRFNDLTLIVIDFEGLTPAGRPAEPTEVAALALRPDGERLVEVGRFAGLTRPPDDVPGTAILEETGHKARLIPGPAAPAPVGFPHRLVPAPWWICEGGANPDGHTNTPHTHVDHLHLALVATASAATEQPDHQLTWFAYNRLGPDLTVSDGSRLLALQLNDLAGRRPRRRRGRPNAAQRLPRSPSNHGAPTNAAQSEGEVGMIDGWTTVSSTTQYTGARLVVRRDEVLRADRTTGTYEYTESVDGVRVVALDDRGRIALVEESVYVCGQRLLMCPGGGCEPGEEPMAAARRELAEEAGIRATEVEPLTMMWRMPAGARTREHLYLARGLSVGEHHRDASEADMELHWVPLEQAVEMCGDGRITEAGTLVAVLLAAQRTTACSGSLAADTV